MEDLTVLTARVRRADDRFQTRLDWLDSRHTFSFGHHYDRQWMGHGRLRVLNQDVVAAGGGFGWHHHRDMEIVSYVLRGALRHQDSMGNDHTIRPGEVQRMTAGTGIQHREWNAVEGETEFLQMWVLPAESGLEPSYDQQRFELSGLHKVASPEGPVVLNAHATLHAGRLARAEGFTYDARGEAWLHVARGSVEVEDLLLEEGDGMGVRDGRIKGTAAADAEVVLWEA